VYGQDVKDEISLSGPTQVDFLDGKKIKRIKLTPSSFGLKKCAVHDLKAKNVDESAQMVWDIFNGRRGAPYDIVVANASACFFIVKKVEDLKSGVKLARMLIDTGKVKEKFISLKQFLEDKK
jgi:anthranilate phosphoribosyltransferase